MTTTLRNFVFVVIVMVALVLPFDCLTFSLRAGIEPRSYLEGRARPKLADLTWKTVARGKWQAAFDAALAFSVRKRDAAILANVRWQRKMIGAASKLFGFDVYPTFYGSGYCRIASWIRIAPIPPKHLPNQESIWIEAAKQYTKIMNDYPKSRYFFAIADTPSLSSTGPFRHIVSNPVQYQHYYRHLKENLPKSCTLIDLSYSKGEDIDRDYFRTDHHWRIHGAVRAYNRIVEYLGMTAIQFEAPAAVTEQEFFGSYARSARDPDVTGDAIFDIAYKRSRLLVNVDGKDVPESYLDYGYRKIPYKKRTVFEEMYGGWFHSAVRIVHINNKTAHSGTLLFVGDSFGNCMERFFAENYRDVYKMDPRFPDFMQTLNDFLSTHAVDDVLFMFTGYGHTKKGLGLM